MKFRRCRLVRVALCVTTLLTACSNNDSGTGELRVALTDAPACGYDRINITVNRLRVHRSGTAGDNEGGWIDIPINPARKVDLLSLQNGILEELAQAPLPAGDYTQLRLVLQNNGGGAPANSVVPTGGSEQRLDTPSGQQSGIKLIHPFTVPAGGLADLILDFNACKSIVARGDGTYGLKPVIGVLPRQVAEIVGNVDTALTGAMISAQFNGNIVRATVPDPTGAFKLTYLNPAATPSVDVVITATGRTTAVISGVPVALQATSRVSTAAMPLTLAVSSTRTASGTVLPAAALPSVRALQAVGTVPKVEVAAVNANMNGGYSLTLPVAAPLLAPFSTTLPLNFAPQDSNAARYTLEASAEGFTAQTAAIDLTSASATQDFTLQ